MCTFKTQEILKNGKVGEDGWVDEQMFITPSYKILNKINEIWYVDRFNALVLVRVKFRIT